MSNPSNQELFQYYNERAPEYECLDIVLLKLNWKFTKHQLCT